MKDSQLPIMLAPSVVKYIKESNERFSTRNARINRSR